MAGRKKAETPETEMETGESMNNPYTPGGNAEERKTVKVKVVIRYNDLEKGKTMEPGETFKTTVERALILLDKGLVKLTE